MKAKSIKTQETIYNLFVFVNDNIISKVGYSSHEFFGDDNEKRYYLKSQVVEDFKKVKVYNVPVSIKTNRLHEGSIDYNTYRDLCNHGHSSIIFEDAFNENNVGSEPFYLITPVKDGKVFFEGIEDVTKPLFPISNDIFIELQPQWFEPYMENNKLRIDKLIDDDYFSAIKLLFNAKHYVSAMKLLLICIDTLSYLEYDDVSGSFRKWLDNYANLYEIKVTSEELWEFRNGLLHMTNTDSRKVISNKVRRLNFYISDKNILSSMDGGALVNFGTLIHTISKAIEKWGETYNNESSKVADLFRRYDSIISDKRSTTITGL